MLGYLSSTSIVSSKVRSIFVVARRTKLLVECTMHFSVVYLPFQKNVGSSRFRRSIPRTFPRDLFARGFTGLSKAYISFLISRVWFAAINFNTGRPPSGGIALRINPIPDRFIRQSIRSDSLSIDTFTETAYFYFFPLLYFGTEAIHPVKK